MFTTAVGTDAGEEEESLAGGDDGAGADAGSSSAAVLKAIVAIPTQSLNMFQINPPTLIPPPTLSIEPLVPEIAIKARVLQYGLIRYGDGIPTKMRLSESTTSWEGSSIPTLQ